MKQNKYKIKIFFCFLFGLNTCSSEEYFLFFNVFNFQFFYIDVVQSQYIEASPLELRHITEELSAAFAELKQGYVRRVLRNIK